MTDQAAWPDWRRLGTPYQPQRPGQEQRKNITALVEVYRLTGSIP